MYFYEMIVIFSSSVSTDYGLYYVTEVYVCKCFVYAWWGLKLDILAIFERCAAGSLPISPGQLSQTVRAPVCQIGCSQFSWRFHQPGGTQKGAPHDYVADYFADFRK